jgi:membrane protein DedA with SNARE-associated domain
MIETVMEVVTGIIGFMGYPGIFFVMAAKNLLPIVPSEVVMPFAGFLAAEGTLSLFGVILAGGLGTGVGSFIVYYLSRRLGEEKVREWSRKNGKYILLHEADITKGLEAFDRRGNWYLFIGRLLPGARYVVPIPAGLKDMKPLTYFLIAFSAGLLWNTPLVLAGLWLGRNWEQVYEWVSTYELIVLAVLAGVLLVFIGKRIYKFKPA